MKFNINDITCMGHIANAIKRNEKYIWGTINDIHGMRYLYTQ